jgi:hypothetical protein
MFKCLVDINNTYDQSFQIYLEVEFDNYDKGRWKTLQEGYIRFPSGWSERSKSAWTVATWHIKLCSKEENTWGIRLNDFIDFWGPNKKGDGLLLQPWCVSFKPELIYWTLIEAK